MVHFQFPLLIELEFEVGFEKSSMLLSFIFEYHRRNSSIINYSFSIETKQEITTDFALIRLTNILSIIEKDVKLLKELGSAKAEDYFQFSLLQKFCLSSSILFA